MSLNLLRLGVAGCTLIVTSLLPCEVSAAENFAPPCLAIAADREAGGRKPQEPVKPENPGREIAEHLRKALEEKQRRQTRKALQELEKAQRIYRDGVAADMLPNLALIAAGYEFIGDRSKSRALYDELAKKAGPQLKEKSRDYAEMLLELADYSMMATESFAVGESIARESLRYLDAAGRGNEEIAARASLKAATLKLFLKQDAAALLLLERARKILPDVSKSVDAGKIQEQLAKAYFQTRRYAESEELLNNLIIYEKNNGYRSTDLITYIALLAEIKSKTRSTKAGVDVFEKWDAELKPYIALRAQLQRAYSDFYAKKDDLMESAEHTNLAERLGNRATAGARAVNALIKHYYVLKENHNFDRAGETAELENVIRRIDDPGAKLHDYAHDLKRSVEAAEKDNEQSKAKAAQSLKLSIEEVTTSLNQYRDRLQETDEDGRATVKVNDVIRRFALLNWVQGRRLTAWQNAFDKKPAKSAFNL